jgi:hypothetical protein
MIQHDPNEWLWKKLDRSDLADILFDADPAIEQLRNLRPQLASWWNELPQETRDALKANTAGMVPPMCRPDVEELGPMGEVDSDRRLPFKLPVILFAYLDVI